MYWFLVPLVIGFIFNCASALTTFYSRRWGERRGALVTVVLRDILGIPVWAIGFALAARAKAPFIFARTAVTNTCGIILIIAGCAIIIYALVAIRSKAAAPSLTDTLVRKGPYAHVRHPIHSGTFLEFAGLFLLKPTVPVAVACVLGTIWIFVQTILEEHDLLQRIPAYREYLVEVPRFVPRRKRGRSGQGKM
jgi:protein-S-isoprenylcysteine O-methyltransferase Ste14